MRTLIRTNQLSGDAYFWKEGFADWKPLFPSDPKQSGSPKQLARLAYFGTEQPLYSAWVFDLIDQDENDPGVAEKIRQWHQDKHRLHPDLFPLDSRTKEDARNWQRHFGNDGIYGYEFRKPTFGQILHVLQDLDSLDPGWHRAANEAREATFMLHLATLYPELCKKDCTYAF